MKVVFQLYEIQNEFFRKPLMKLLSQIPVPVDVPERNKTSILFRQSFVLSNADIVPSWGIYHQTMAGKFVIRIGQLYPPV